MSTTRTTDRPHRSERREDHRRVSLSDRLALRVGLALIVWSRRTSRGGNRRVRPERSHEEYRRLALQLAADRRAAERRLAESMLFWR